MARVFVPKYTDKQTGKKRKSPNCHVAFDDHNGTRRRVVGFPVSAGKGRSEALGTKLERLVSCRAVGEPLTPDLLNWVENMAPILRDKLAGWDVIEAPKCERFKPISYQMIGYMHVMRAKGNDPKHIRQTIRKIGEIVRHSGIRLLSDITAEDVEAYLTKRRIGRKTITPKTCNAYLTAMKGFCNWLVKAGRISRSPLAGVEPMPVVDEESRWPLTISEMRVLLEVTEEGPVQFKMNGSERALLYRLAVETGYRAGELRSLVRASFDLDSNNPTIRLLAGVSKGKRRSSIPLRPETVVLLREHLASKAPAASAFAMPDSTHTAEMIRADMIDARIPITDILGRKRDFHNLRHTCGTWLANAGVHPKTIQTIMRHSTFRLTMDTYAHADRDQTAVAIGQMPSLSESTISMATGTDNATANDCSQSACATLAQEGGQLQPNKTKPGQCQMDGGTHVTAGVQKKSPDSKGQWARLDSNQCRHKPADLQSAPFGRFGTRPVDGQVSYPIDD